MSVMTREPIQRPRAIDLFSGCGGLTLGLRQAGFAVIGAVESQDLAVETYLLNHPTVRVWPTDIRDLTVSAVMTELNLETGELDLLAGCPPCQGFSTMRTLNGGRNIDDTRNSLIDDFFRFVWGMRPKAVILENVPGLKAHVSFQRLCEALTAVGYAVQHTVLDAADFGVPQRRQRLILVASSQGPVKLVTSADRKRTVLTAIGSLPRSGSGTDALHDYAEHRSPRIMELIKRIPKNGGSLADVGPGFQLECHKRTNGFKDVYGRMAWDSVAPTLTSGCINPSKGRFLHPREDRAITLREAALLQAFPLSYRVSLRRGRFAAAEMIGNALPPRFVRPQARVIRTHLAAHESSNGR